MLTSPLMEAQTLYFSESNIACLCMARVICNFSWKWPNGSVKKAPHQLVLMTSELQQEILHIEVSITTNCITKFTRHAGNAYVMRKYIKRGCIMLLPTETTIVHNCECNYII